MGNVVLEETIINRCEMKFLAGTTNGLYLGTKKIKGGWIYGITWDEKSRLYLGSNRLGAGGVDQWTSDFRNVIEIGRPIHDIHQILWRDGMLYVTNTAENTLDIFGKEEIERHSWAEQDDDIHLNSVWVDNGLIWVVEHRRGVMPARIRAFDEDWNLVRTEKFFKLPTDCNWGLHNIYVENDILYTLSTTLFLMRNLETGKESRIEFGGYLRGLARGDNFWLVGKSRLAKRQNRNSGNGSVLVLDNKFEIVDEIMLPDCGQVQEVRLLNGDRAHNDLAWSKCSLEETA